MRSEPGPGRGAPARDVVTVRSVRGTELPDGSVVDAASLPPGPQPRTAEHAVVRMDAGSRQLLSLAVASPDVARAPAMVFLERVDRAADPVSVEIVAFPHDEVTAGAARLGADLPPGTVLTQRDARTVGITAERQVAAVRWLPSTGQVMEVYVRPDMRRRGIATTLLVLGEAVTVAREWPRLWGSGVRTALGDAMLRGWRWGTGRVARLTRVAPPMTPPDDAVGIERRNLEPDAS